MIAKKNPVRVLQEPFIKMILEKLKDSKVYIHFTGEQSVAEKIAREGFKYTDSLEKTTAEISPSKIAVKYKFQLYRDYGDYMIVLCIPLLLFDNLASRKVDTRHDVMYNLGLCEHHPEEELDYTLSSKFIYGYIDLMSNKFHKNELFL
jgi:hypothetical protein